MRRDIFEQRSSIEQWIAEHRPKAFICRELRCKPETLNSYLGKMDIEYSGNMGGKGHKYCPNCHALTDNHAGRGSSKQSSQVSKGLAS